MDSVAEKSVADVQRMNFCNIKMVGWKEGREGPAQGVVEQLMTSKPLLPPNTNPKAHCKINPNSSSKPARSNTGYYNFNLEFRTLTLQMTIGIKTRNPKLSVFDSARPCISQSEIFIVKVTDHYSARRGSMDKFIIAEINAHVRDTFVFLFRPEKNEI